MGGVVAIWVGFWGRCLLDLLANVPVDRVPIRFGMLAAVSAVNIPERLAPRSSGTLAARRGGLIA